MNSRAFRRSAVAVAAFSASAIVLAGCAGGSGSTPSADPNEEITLTIATFNNFGYTDELLQEYMDENPNVTIVHNKAAESGDARANYFQKLGKEGLADIEAVEIDWLAEGMQYSDLLAPVPDDLKGRWLDWKEAAATDPDGNLIGYGTDIGPQAICYRADLFAAAGLPSDPGRGRRAVRRRLGQLLRRRRPVQGRHRQADDRLGQLGAPGHREPDGVHVHRARRHGHRHRRTPSSRTRTTRSSSAPSPTRPTPVSGATTGTRR